MKKGILRTLFVIVICGFFLASTGLFNSFAAQSRKQAPRHAQRSTSKAKATKPASNQRVRAVQKALNKEGFKLKVDGLMGKHTRAAIKKFQKENGLKVTGKPDAATLVKLGIM